MLCRDNEINVQDLGIVVGVHRGRWVYPTDIANGLCTGLPNVSRRLKKLDKLVSRQPGNSNRVVISCTPDGKKLAEEYLNMIV